MVFAERGVCLPRQATAILLFLLLMFITIGACCFWAFLFDDRPDWLGPLMTVIWLLSGGGIVLLLYLLWREFCRLPGDLSNWASSVLHGDLSARMPFHGEHCPSKNIRQHINRISSSYEAMAAQQQLYLVQQENYLAQKKYHLNVLYEIADCINSSSDLDGLLKCFLQTMQGVSKAKALSVRLLDENNQLKLMAGIGLDSCAGEPCQSVPDQECACARSMVENKVIHKTDLSRCKLTYRSKFSDSNDLEMLAIPLRYRGESIGVLNLLVPRLLNEETSLTSEDVLLQSIGKHLGMAIEQADVEENSRVLSIVQERTRMAHELHDSLAQTLASLRYKVRLFDESLPKEHKPKLQQELKGLVSGIDEASRELRCLITQFRAPIDGKGILRAVELVVERFRQETGFDVFFYHNWEFKGLGYDDGLEVVRIVQEALTNIRKHSGSETVRILMHSSEAGDCSILVEDDGIGLPDDRPKYNPETGEHIGLTIMQERAARLGGELQLDSDGGGVLLQLNFKASVPKLNLPRLSGN